MKEDILLDIPTKPLVPANEAARGKSEHDTARPHASDSSDLFSSAWEWEQCCYYFTE